MRCSVGLLRNSVAAITALAAAPVGALAVTLQPKWREGVRERLGRVSEEVPGSIWIHAASVGEASAALPLFRSLESAGYRITPSTMTSTGQTLLASQRPDLAARLAPLDHPWCVDAALRRVDPAALVLIETEVWPTWIAAASRRNIPVVVVSGRISDRSLPRYRKLRALLGPTLARLDAVGARSDTDAQRFEELGVHPERISVTGDLKLDRIDAEHGSPALDPVLARVLEERPLFVAGSTHAPEEAACLEALIALNRADQDAALVLAPRYPDRAGEVAQLVRAKNLPLRVRSELGAAPLASGEVFLLDTVGELVSLYAKARVAFVGGSLAARGGHNLLEPAAAGVPVLFGPHTENVREAVSWLEAAGAGRRVSDAATLAEAVLDFFQHAERARAAGEAGRKALAPHRGAALRCAQLIVRRLRDPGEKRAG